MSEVSFNISSIDQPEYESVNHPIDRIENRMINFVVLRNLFRSLRNYGLNPREWQIDRNLSPRHSTIEFRHRFDESFRVDGKVVRSSVLGAELRELRIVSI